MPRRLIVVTLILCAAGSVAPRSRAAEGVPRDKWLSELAKVLPGALCGAAYFRECFAVADAACRKEADLAASACVKKDKALLPATVDGQSGSEWGAKIGSCAGGGLEKALAAKKKTDAKCSDASQWIGK